MVLNPELYKRLQVVFGEVRIAHEGEIAVSVSSSLRFTPPQLGRNTSFDLRGRSGEEVNRGEQYRVCCPFCGDSRFRLYIGYLWDRKPTALFCHNETHCHQDIDNRRELRRKVLQSTGPVSFGIVPESVIESGIVASVQVPGDVTLLGELDRWHPTVVYLQERKYDVGELSDIYHVGHCNSVIDHSHRLLRGRVFIPIERKGELIGWQGRFVGERDWKSCPVPKYYNLPSMPKRFFLYNEDFGLSGEDVIVFEGVAKVWRMGGPSVAVLGSTLSGPQARLLMDRPGRGMTAIFFDGGAEQQRDDAVARLKPALGDRVFGVEVPENFDPDKYDRDFLWGMVEKQAADRGLKLADR